MNEFMVLSAPKTVGYYEIGGNYGLRVMLCQRPIWLHRVMMKACLGWVWRDYSAG